VAPTNPAVQVDFIQSAPRVGESMAHIQVATAFPGSPLAVPVDGNTNVMGRPFEHQFVANGSSVYAVLSGASGAPEADVYASQDNGKTYQKTAYTILGGPECATLAVDPVNPKLVYLAYIGGTNVNGVTLRVAVSEDGAKTFPVEYDLEDDLSNLASFVCPDVNAPQANSVIVTGFSGPPGSPHIATFVSTQVGKGIGPVGQPGIPYGNEDMELGNDTNTASVIGCGVGSNSGGNGVRLSSNGQGTVCTFSEFLECVNAGQNGVTVQCSKDSGATWGTAITVSNAPSSTSAYPTGSVSPGGKVAVTWINSVAEDGGQTAETFIAISEDGGQTFGAPIQYPTAFRVAIQGSPSYPVVGWENDEVLWLGQTMTIGNINYTYVDKTCDAGQSWSGLVKLGAYGNSSFIETTDGMLAGVYAPGNGSGAGVFAIPLSSAGP
jgi:hypothetical protein